MEFDTSNEPTHSHAVHTALENPDSGPEWKENAALGSRPCPPALTRNGFEPPWTPVLAEDTVQRPQGEPQAGALVLVGHNDARVADVKPRVPVHDVIDHLNDVSDHLS